MPEEDDDALGAMLGDRLKGAGGADDGDESSETAAENRPDAGDETGSTDGPESTDSADGTDDDGETTRSRSPFPLYVTPALKADVQNRFEKFNARRTLNDEPQVEKHKHFMEGLLRAGLDNPDLEAYVRDEFEE
jgi:hypothetical protein